jgi:cobalt/nickel transport protein
MSGALKSSLLLAAVVLLILIPLMMVKAPTATPDDGQTAIFTGSDAQAQGVIQTLAPDYQPWFASLFTPPSIEIESLLFALQAALGAGVIGYYAGYVRGKRAGTPPPDGTDRAH